MIKRILLTCSLVFASQITLGADHYFCASADMDGDLAKPSKRHVRFATFNAFLNRNQSGQLVADLTDPSDQLTDDDNSDTQTRAVAEIIQRVRPDIILLNEFDYDAKGEAITLFQDNFLSQSQNGREPIHYPYVYLAESNTGLPSGLDFDNNGSNNGPGDAFGFGFFPGQFGMVLLSKHPIAERKVRTFQNFLWKDMPGAVLPDDATTPAPQDYYNQEELNVFRLSSKSHWDIPVWIDGRLVHILAAHPTPPVFDGEEDRNGRRNHDEIRFWADYIKGRHQARYIYDDNGRRGGLRRYSPFVILGDYNADINDGDSTNQAIAQLLDNKAIDTRFVPGSLGGLEDSAREGLINDLHNGSPALDTADFNPNGPGNLRVDYVLPSKFGLRPTCGGVFWPTENDDSFYLIGSGFPVISSDHRLVWLDAVISRW